ncbi:MAG: ribokinase, partial [Gammaproteobacteria bacterium]
MIINFGSINIDHVYRVTSLPKPGETLAAQYYAKFLGGKGVNQSIAIAKAGGEVVHVGAVGEDGSWALAEVKRLGVNTEAVSMLDCATGHAIIFVDDDAENQIVIEGGANQQLRKYAIDHALSQANPKADWVLLQNETNLADYIVNEACRRGLRIAYAAAPFVAETTCSLLPNIQLLVVNEGEARSLAHALGVEETAIPVPELLITRGTAGAELVIDGRSYQQSAFQVDAVDTTGAGDTFTGSFLARYSRGDSVESALEYA